MTYSDPEKQKAFQRQWQRASRQKLRAQALAALGGKCCQCGYDAHNAALHFDHIQPVLRTREKRDRERNYYKVYRAILKGETENIQVLCANCHAIKTFNQDREKFGRFNPDVFVPSKRKPGRRI